MSSSTHLPVLLLSCFLVLVLSPAYGAESMGIGVKDAGLFGSLKEEKSRKVIDVTDYRRTGPNIPGGPHYSNVNNAMSLTVTRVLQYTSVSAPPFMLSRTRAVSCIWRRSDGNRREDASLFGSLKEEKSRKMVDVTDYRPPGANIPGGPHFANDEKSRKMVDINDYLPIGPSIPEGLHYSNVIHAMSLTDEKSRKMVDVTDYRPPGANIPGGPHFANGREIKKDG
ncbi:hypothetical protein SDJN03_23023, partial [Cucurbita argyrosperma subsp. sororia]